MYQETRKATRSLLRKLGITNMILKCKRIFEFHQNTSSHEYLLWFQTLHLQQHWENISFKIFNNELLIKLTSNDHGVSLNSCCRLVNDLYDHHPLNPNLTSVFKWLVKKCVCVSPTTIIVSAQSLAHGHCVMGIKALIYLPICTCSKWLVCLDIR